MILGGSVTLGGRTCLWDYPRTLGGGGGEMRTQGGRREWKVCVSVASAHQPFQILVGSLVPENVGEITSGF